MESFTRNLITSNAGSDHPRHIPVSKYRAAASLYLIAILSAAFTGLALAAEPLHDILSIHPVEQESLTGQTYAPGDATTVLSVPVAYALGATHRINMDVEIVNLEPDYIKLDGLSVDFGNSVPVVALSGQELLELPEGLLTTQLGDDDLRRPMLTNGGFMVTGLMLEPRMDEHDTLTFGEALDILSYRNDDSAGYLVAGSQQFLIGDPPQSPDDPWPGVGTQGFVAKYNSTGTMAW